MDAVFKWLQNISPSQLCIIFGIVCVFLGASSGIMGVHIEDSFRWFFVVFGILTFSLGIILSIIKAKAKADEARRDDDKEIRIEKIRAGLDPTEDATVYK